MESVIIALGSNIEPKVSHLNQAINLMSQLDYLEVLKQSTVYQTVPKGYADQDDFYNMVVEVSANTTPTQLLSDLQEIERELKRKRTIKNGPRTIDLDILLMGNQTSDTDELVVPHPRMHERAFVLVPLTEIAPNYLMPHSNQTVKDLKCALSEQEKADVESIGQLSTLLEKE